jgi:predicted nucleotidyltransferase
MDLELFTKLKTENRIPNRVCLLGYVGSHSHGTYIPKNNPDSIDDIDLMGLAIGPKSSYIGLGNFEQHLHQKDEWDIVVFEARKFVRLLLKQNPNVIGLLWLRGEDYIYLSEAAQQLIDQRDIFSSKLIYKSFTGYAAGQLHKMTHYKFEGYMGAKRKELVDRHGYDCKNAAHLIRLLRMGNEFLRTGVLQVFRPDAEELKVIKTGGWTLEQVKAESQRLFAESEEALRTSPLPAEPNQQQAENLLIDLIEEAWIESIDF